MAAAQPDPVPSIGTVITSKGQRYELSAVHAHTRRDGEATTLLRWNSRCADCAAPFSFRTPLRAIWLNRRCTGCARPGARVSTTPPTAAPADPPST